MGTRGWLITIGVILLAVYWTPLTNMHLGTRADGFMQRVAPPAMEYVPSTAPTAPVSTVSVVRTSAVAAVREMPLPRQRVVDFDSTAPMEKVECYDHAGQFQLIRAEACLLGDDNKYHWQGPKH